MSRLSRRGWLFFCCLARGSLLPRGPLRRASTKIFFSSLRESADVCARALSAGPSARFLAGVMVIDLRPNRVRGLVAPQAFAVISRYVPLRRIGRRRESGHRAQILS